MAHSLPDGIYTLLKNPNLSKNIVLDYEYARRAPFSIEKKNKDKLARENERTFTQKHT